MELIIDILSTKANYKILNILNHANQALCIKEMILSSKLGTRSVYITLDKLEKEKLINKIFVSNEVRYKINSKHSFYNTLSKILNLLNDFSIQLESKKYKKRAKEVIPVIENLLELKEIK